MPKLTRLSAYTALAIALATAAAAQEEAAGEEEAEASQPAETEGAEESQPSEEAPAAEEPEGAEGETTATAEKEEELTAGTYNVRLVDLEQRINELKEQIFRSKARLSLLAETVLQGVVAGGQARIVHENKMGGSYKLVKVLYALDGAPIFNKADEQGGLDEQETFDVYNGSIVPGEHTLTVNLEYQGSGYGIFSYLKGYRFKVRSDYTFNAPEGKTVTVRAVSYEKGGPTAPLEERPAIRYVERVASGTRGKGEGGE